MSNYFRKFIFFMFIFFGVIFFFSPSVFAVYDHLKIEYWDGLGWVEQSSLPTPIDVTQSISFDIRVTARHGDDSLLTSGQGAYALVKITCDTGATIPSFPITDNLINGQKIINVTFDLGSIPVGSSFVNRHFEAEDANDPVGYGHGHLYVEVHRFVDSFDVALDTPPPKVAGVPFNITVTARDSEGNIATTFSDDVVLSCAIGDMDSTLIQGFNFVNGVANGFGVTLYGSDPSTRLNTVYATNTVMYPGQGSYPNGSTGSFAVNPAAFNKILLLFPGETLIPATKAGTGKTGSPGGQTAGMDFIGVDAIATDAFWNPVNAGPYPVITFTSSDTHALTVLPPPFAMVSHTATFDNINLKTAGDQWVRVEENINNTTSTSYPIQIDAANYNYFVFDPIGNQFTTTPFVVTVTAYDQFDNIATSYNKTNVPLTSTRDYVGPPYESVVVPNTLNFSSGVANQTISVTRVGGPGSYITVTDPDDEISADSNNFQIFHGPFTTVLVLFNGESQHSGIAPGKTGTPSDYVTVGDTVTVTVIATDDWWNSITDGTAGLPITISSDTGYIKSLDDGNSLSIVTGQGTYDVVFLTAASDSAPYTAETQRITAATGPVPDIKGNSSYITVHPASYSRLVLVAPGENLDPGTPTEPDGKTGNPSAQESTNPFDLIVAAVDQFWNPVETGSYTVKFSSSDPNANLPVGDQLMSSVVESFSGVFLDTLGWQWIKVEDVNNSSIFDTVVIEVVHGPLDHFSFSEVSSPQKVGNSFNVRIIAEDVANKKVLSYDGVTIDLDCNTGAGTYTPATITFTKGEWSGSVTINRAGSGIYLSCSDGPADGKNWPPFTVNTDDYTKLLVLLPDEAATPGLAPGKTGSVNSKTAGDSVNAVVLAVDDQWNTVTSAAPTINLSTDKYSEIPVNNVALNNGQGVFEIKFRTAAMQTVTVQDVNQVTITSTSTITINPGNYTKLQIIAPGEVPDPGGWEVDGKTGTPVNQKTGEGFPVQVLAADNFWNQVSSINGGQVHLISNDGSLVSPEQDSPYISGSCNLQVYLGNPGLVEITASDLGYLGKIPQTVKIVLEQGYIYEVITPANAVAGPPGFTMTVRLVDPAAPGVPIPGENPTITIVPFLANHKPASGSLGITTAALTNGEVIIANQTYDVAEDICIRVSDDYAREKYGDSIHVVASALKYEVVVPGEATVGPPNYFSVTVELRDTLTNNIVPAPADREIDLVIYCKEKGIPGEGITGVSKVTISKGEGTATIQESYTKAEEVYIKVSDASLVEGESDSFEMKPAEYKRLQIVAPGEELRPGIPSETGKDETKTPDTWQAGIPFPVTVRAVDQYWNLTDFTGGRIHLVSSDSSLNDTNPSNQNASFQEGIISFTITLHTPGDIKVTVSDLDNPLKTPQSVDIPISFAVYHIVTPINASTNGTFTMLVNLVDGNTGNLILADHQFSLTPLLANHEPAGGTLGITSDKITGGQVTISNQSYNLVEDICIKLVDDYGRVSYSDSIHMQSSSLKYEIIVSTRVPVGPPETFQIIINLIDDSTEEKESVTTMDRQVNIDAYVLDGNPATGRLAVSNAFLKEGKAIINQAYDKIEGIYLQVWDISGEVNDGISSNILVVAGKEVDLNLTVPAILEAGQSSPVIAILKDAHGNIASNLQVYFEVSGEATIDSDYDFTDALGEASVKITCNEYAHDGVVLIKAYTGNISKAERIEIHGVPNTSLSVKGVYTEVEDLIYAKPETPFILVSESQIGVDTIYYKIDGNSWQEYISEFFISEVGMHNINYYAKDIHNHIEEIKVSKKIQISQSGPGLLEVINYPNPFQAGKEPTFIEYNLNQPSNVVITIYDLLGQIVWEKKFRAGENGGDVINSVAWWGRNGLEKVVGNGGYICRIWIEKERKQLIRKIAVVK